MTESESLSIGEMLDLLKAEFPDVTISKIRFLESQGLLDPERTASGYRKFYQGDVERLRWILRQQRENFLPLKVIKGRLEAEGDAVFAATGPGAGVDVNVDAGAGAVPDASVPGASAPRTTATVPEPSPAPPSPAPRASPAGEPAPDPDPTPSPAAPPVSPSGEVERPAATPTAFSRDELARASGLSPSELSQLERHGLVAGTSVGSQLSYDAEALEVARLAAAFSHHGIEPRHLRMYKNSAEREANFYEQVVLPLVKQRNPAARQQAADTLSALSELGDNLRRSLLRQALREIGQERKSPRRN